MLLINMNCRNQHLEIHRRSRHQKCLLIKNKRVYILIKRNPKNLESSLKYTAEAVDGQSNLWYKLLQNGGHIAQQSTNGMPIVVAPASEGSTPYTQLPTPSLALCTGSAANLSGKKRSEALVTREKQQH